MARHKKSRKQVQQDETHAREARLAYVGRLTTGLAHQIRTPLNAIQLNAQLLAEDLPHLPEPDRETFGRRLDRIRSEAESLSATLNEFLAFARPPAIAKVPMDLRKFLEDSVEFMSPACLKQGIEISLDYEEELYPVRIDPKQLSQVVLALLENAVQAIRGPGHITLSARERDRVVEIGIADDGGGVPADIEEKIFQEFFTTREHGTGLGLVIARRIVEEHGGELELSNKPGVGAVFTIRLPRARVIDYEQSVS